MTKRHKVTKVQRESKLGPKLNYEGESLDWKTPETQYEVNKNEWKTYRLKPEYP